MRRLLFLAAALAGCDRPSKQDPVARDLSRALEPAPSEPLDTADQRKRDQLERCKFVYHDEQGLRECLVLKNSWTPQDAAREIAIYKAAIARTLDSLRHMRDSVDRAEHRLGDSIRRVAQRKYAAEQRRRAVSDSIAAAPESARVAKQRWDFVIQAEKEKSN